MPLSGEEGRQRGARLWNRATFVLLTAAIALRIAVVLATRNDVVFRVPYLDAAFYHFWAMSLATHAGDFVDAYFLGPLYPHVLSWIYRMGGTEILLVRLLQTSFGFVNLLLVLKLGRRLDKPSSGFFAVLLLAFHGTLFFYEGILVMESLMTTLVLGASALLLIPAGSRSIRVTTTLVAGVLLGAATAGRGTVLLLLPVFLWILWKPLRPQKSVLAPSKSRTEGMEFLPSHPSPRSLAILLILAWGLPLVPVYQHNASRGAPWTLTTNAGVNFYAGNHEGCRGRFRPPPGIEFFGETADLPTQASDAARTPSSTALPPTLSKRALTTEAVAASERAADSAYWFQQAGSWIRSQPADFAALWMRKVALVLQSSETGQIESPSFHRRRLPLLRIFWVGWGLLVSLAVVGLWSGWRQRSTRAATQRLALLIMTLLLPCVIFFVTARYRLVAVPLLCVLAGMGATALLTEWRLQRRRFWMSLALWAAVFLLTRVGGQTSTPRQAWENAQMAERLYAVGQLDEAIVFQQAASQLQPRRLEIQLNLALFLSERNAPGDVVAAERMVRSLVGRFPDRPILLFNWASLLEQTGDPETARRVYRRVLELAPSFEAARDNLDDLEGR